MPLVLPPRPQVIAGRHTTDDGLFGPDSDVEPHSEPVMSLVGVLARQTGRYLLSITFGDTATARRAGAILRRVIEAFGPPRQGQAPISGH